MVARPALVSEQDQTPVLPGPGPGSEPSGLSMDVLTLLRLVVRHWRVTAPALLLTLVGLVALLQAASPTYQASGSIALLTPPEAPDVGATPEVTPGEGGQNPFARYGDLSIMADIVGRVMAGPTAREDLAAQGVTGYEVVANRFQRGPVIEVTGEGSSAEAAIRSAEVTLAEVEKVLSELQRAEGADPDYFIQGAPLEPPSKATAEYGSTMRMAIGALMVGLVCTLGLALLAEAITRRRPARPAPATGPASPDAAGRSSREAVGPAAETPIPVMPEPVGSDGQRSAPEGRTAGRRAASSPRGLPPPRRRERSRRESVPDRPDEPPLGDRRTHPATDVTDRSR